MMKTKGNKVIGRTILAMARFLALAFLPSRALAVELLPDAECGLAVRRKPNSWSARPRLLVVRLQPIRR
jgi:hypothetical protein